METIDSKPSLVRWWRQVCFVPLFYGLHGLTGVNRQWLTETVKSKLNEKVTQAEQGHRGEVFLIIENHLPIAQAYHMDCRERAIELFSEYRVWDTAENTGVLVYVNICEHDLEIVADRGIDEHVSPTVWQAMCDKAIAGLAKKQIETSLSNLLDEIGQLLRQYYYLENDPSGNELSDNLIHLR